jgi:hypothetical protein
MTIGGVWEEASTRYTPPIVISDYRQSQQPSYNDKKSKTAKC